MQKRLFRVNEGKVIFGVCGGIAEYLRVDPTVIRLIWAIVGLMGGFGLLAYIVATLIIPEKPLGIEE